jgi:hypothetical protein
MKVMKSLFLAIMICDLSAVAQYTYFSKLILPPDSENNNGGGCTNLVVQDSVFWCWGGVFSNGSYANYLVKVDGETGQVLGEFELPYENYVNYLMWGDVFQPTMDGGFIGACSLGALDSTPSPVYTFKTSQNGEYQWESFVDEFDSDSTTASGKLTRELSSGQIVTLGIIQYDVLNEPNDNTGVVVTRLSESGDHIGTSILPVWNNQWQDTITHYSCWVTDLVELPDTELLIAGEWLEVGFVPFFMKLNAENEVIGHFKMGNEEIGNYHLWLVPRDDGNIMFSFANGIGIDEEEEIEIWGMTLGLFDPSSMDTVWTKTYPHQGIIQRLQDFERTPDGGYIMLAHGFETDPEQIVLRLLKTDAEGNEEWYKEYYPPTGTWDLMMHDIEITVDGGMAMVGYLIVDTEGFYKTWLLKLDACGDLVWNGCPFVGIEENEPVSFSISPNPTNHSIQVQCSEIIHDISMTDLSGRQVFAQLIMSETKEMDLSELSSGVYLLQATYMDGKTEVVRVVRE